MRRVSRAPLLHEIRKHPRHWLRAYRHPVGPGAGKVGLALLRVRAKLDSMVRIGGWVPACAAGLAMACDSSGTVVGGDAGLEAGAHIEAGPHEDGSVGGDG